ncbi:MAG: methyl-accepting chemotaxis protein [Velocimicrobium sp.]
MNILLGGISYTNSVQSLKQANIISMENSMGMLQEYLNLSLSNLTAKVQSIAANELIRSYYDGDYSGNISEEKKRFKEIRNVLYSNIMVDNSIMNFSIFGNKGTGFDYNHEDLKKEQSNSLLASDTIKELSSSNQKGVWLGEHASIDEVLQRKDSRYSVSYIQQLTNSSLMPIGYIVLDIPEEFISETLNRISIPKGSVIGFITADGKETVSHQTMDPVFTDTAFYDKARKNDSAKGYEQVNYKNGSYLFFYNKADVGGGMICALVSQDAIMASVNKVGKITIGLVVIATLIAILIGSYVARNISGEISKTNLVLARVADGNLTEELHSDRKDEFEKLSVSINNTINSMRSLIIRIAQVVEQLSYSSTTVQDNSNRLLEATKNITYGVKNIEEGVTQQANDSQNCFMQMGELSIKITNVTCSTEEVKKVATDTNKSVIKGVEIMDILCGKSQNTMEITQNVIEKVHSFEQTSREIGNIVDFINDIARQSKLLSLNASIEAARAGNEGRGFAVVAEEIHKLADQSSDCAEEINRNISTLLLQTNSTVEAASMAKEIVISQEQTLKESFEVFSEIGSYVETLLINIEKITCDMVSIEESRGRTLNSIESISATSEESAAIASELGVSVQGQFESVEVLYESALTLEKDSKELLDAISIFKI